MGSSPPSIVTHAAAATATAVGNAISTASVPGRSLTSTYIRGFLVGAGFILVVETLAIVAIALILFDPLRRKVVPPPPEFSTEGLLDTDPTASTASKVPSSSSSSKSASAPSNAAGGTPTVKLGAPTGNTVTATHSRARDLINEHEEPWPENIVAFLQEELAPKEGVDLPYKPPPVPARTNSLSSAFKSATGRVNRSATVTGGANGAGQQQRTDGSTGSLDSQGQPAAPVAEFSAMSPTEMPVWANAVVQRFFLALRESELYKSRMKAKMTERMNLKLQNNSFVSHVRVLDISLGEYAPKILGVRLLKGVTEDIAVSLELDVSYEGGGSLAIEATLTGGLSIPVRVHLSGFAGKLRVRCPSIGWADMLAIAFVEDPGINFIVDSPLTVGDNEMVRGVVNRMLAGIIRRIFMDMWVLPSWRHFFLPLMSPSPAEELARMDLAATTKPPPISRRKKVAEKATSLWENRHPILKGQSGTISRPGSAQSKTAVSGPSDSLHTKTFATTAEITPPFDSAIDTMESSLLSAFLSMARDKDESTNPPKSADDSAGVESEGQTEVMGAIFKPSLPLNTWKTIRNRNGVHILKRRQQVHGTQQTVDVNKSIIQINCDAERVFSILSHPEHNRHIEESYLVSTVMKQFDDARSVRHMIYNYGKNATKDYLVFEVARKIPSLPSTVTDDDKEPVQHDQFVVVTRSVASVKNSSGAPSAVKEEVPDKTATQDAIAEETLPKSQEASDKEPDTNDTRTSRKLSVSSANESSSRSSSPGQPASLFSVSPPKGSIIKQSTPESLVTSASSSTPTASKASNAPTPTSTVYIFGYLVEPSPSNPSNSCTVTIVSQLSPDLSKLEANFNMGRKIKAFVEEYVALSSNLSGEGGADGASTGSNVGLGAFGATGSEMRRRRMFRSATTNSASSVLSTSSGESGEKRIDKLKNLVSSTTTYLMKGRRVPSWLNNGANGGSSNSGNHAPSGVVPVAEDADSDLDLGSTVTAATLPVGRASTDCALEVKMKDLSDIENEEHKVQLSPQHFEETDLKVPIAENDENLPTADPDLFVAPEILTTTQRTSVFASIEPILERTATQEHPKHQVAQKEPDDTASVTGSFVSSSTHSSTGERQGLLNKFAGMSSGEIISSAATVAKTVAAKRPLGFLKRGLNRIGRVGGPEGFSTGAESPFSIGDPLDSTPLTELKVLGKDVSRAEVVFQRNQYGPYVEIAWEFFAKTELSLSFGVTFKPSNTAVPHTYESHLLYPESQVERGDRQILSMGTQTVSPTRPHRSTLSLSEFPSGKFIFVWDNTGGARKTVKEILYRVLIRPFENPKMHSVIPTQQILEGDVGEFGLGPLVESKSHATGCVGDVTISRKSLYQVTLIYDKSMDVKHTVGESADTQTYLTWDFGTGGLDLFFGVSYQKLEGGISATASKDPLISRPTTNPVSIPLKSSSSDLSGLSSSPPRSTERVPLASRLAEAVSKDHSSENSHSSHPKTTTASQDFEPLLNSGSLNSSAARQHRPIHLVPVGKVVAPRGQTLSGTIPISGQYGAYTFVWDNTHSVLLPKIISFRVATVTTLALREEDDDVEDDGEERITFDNEVQTLRSELHAQTMELPKEVVEVATVAESVPIYTTVQPAGQQVSSAQSSQDAPHSNTFAAIDDNDSPHGDVGQLDDGTAAETASRQATDSSNSTLPLPQVATNSTIENQSETSELFSSVAAVESTSPLTSADEKPSDPLQLSIL
ncbi:hypothetical protein HDV05_008644 [Chytridiales sp. JEL 0842]|nr:hypothetical protein HDV05_008644 [Chytridiales sp. JEL 0842]